MQSKAAALHVCSNGGWCFSLCQPDIQAALPCTNVCSSPPCLLPETYAKACLQ